MRSLTDENFDALSGRRLVARDFLWIIARDLDTGDPVTDGLWSDVGSTTVDVIDPDTGAVQSRSFTGAASLVQISAIPLVSNISVQNVTITLSQIAEHVVDLVHGYDCKQAKVQIFRGLYDPDTRSLVSPAIPRFVGFIDQIKINTPREGEEGSVEVTCTSHTQEMTRSNPDTRSHESQILRASGDTFYKDVSVVGEWEHFWGKKSEKISTTGKNGTQAGGFNG